MKRDLYQRVVLSCDIPEYNLKRDDIATLKVFHVLWEQGAGGSNPSTPTNK